MKIKIAISILLIVVAGFGFYFLKSNRQKVNLAKGILALNSDKQIYIPGETVHLQIAALDPQGHTICNADLELLINGQKTGGIKNSSTCGDGNVTGNPDYFYDIKIDRTGNYSIKLTDNTTGQIAKNQFSVVASREVDIVRETATRINPLKAERYPVKLIVTATKDFQGEISDIIPAGFTIPWQGPAKVTDNGDKGKVITWQVDIKAGETKELIYEYSAPKTGPAIYKIGNNSEWQIVATK